MKVSVQAYRLAGEGEKVLNIKGVEVNGPDGAIETLRAYLKAAQILWPEETGKYFLGKTPEKRVKKT